MYTSYYNNKFLHHYIYWQNEIIPISYTCHQKYANYKTYLPLVPPWVLVDCYKKNQITWEEYEKYYTDEVLKSLNPSDVYEELGKRAILLCWEVPNKHCHRHIVAQWLNNNLGNCITELPDTSSKFINEINKEKRKDLWYGSKTL